MKRSFSCTLLAVALLAYASAQAQDTLHENFASPPPDARPALRWWLPGNDVTREGLRQALKAACDAGFGAVEIQSFRAGLWNVIGSGCPTGGAGVDPEHGMMELRSAALAALHCAPA